MIVFFFFTVRRGFCRSYFIRGRGYRVCCVSRGEVCGGKIGVFSRASVRGVRCLGLFFWGSRGLGRRR